ncbi:bifunctional adenosylcobinamide kinase/adenosylcobinamide-phosphate guanylyltransferase [Corticibacter populi]|nr:bifunctional adenosylcobinamide kinase/adenosylcobinamide-phosphate guanylyltransferase [Corticibacter populi]
MPCSRHTLVLGGQKSGKSRHAETLAARWLARDRAHEAVLVATARPWDAEMRARIARHQQDRLRRVPAMRTVEEPLQLADCIARHSQPHVLLVVDCMGMWLTNWLMPADASQHDGGDHDGDAALAQRRAAWQGACAALRQALDAAPGPVLMVSNEIGWGVIPLGREVRVFVDALGLLNQQLAAQCVTVVLMAAGLPLMLKQPDTPDGGP